MFIYTLRRLHKNTSTSLLPQSLNMTGSSRRTLAPLVALLSLGVSDKSDNFSLFPLFLHFYFSVAPATNPVYYDPKSWQGFCPGRTLLKKLRKLRKLRKLNKHNNSHYNNNNNKTIKE